MVGMVKARAASGERERAPARRGGNRPMIGLTMFGVTTPCVEAIVDALDDDFECLVFHATGIGGQSMEKLVDSGAMVGVIDITTTEVCDLLLRRRAAGDRRPLRRDRAHARPLYRLVRRARHGEFRPHGQRARALPRPHAACSQSDGNADAHHAEENARDRPLDRRAAQSDGRPGPLLPARKAGCPRSTQPGRPFSDPNADDELFRALETTVRQTAPRRLIRRAGCISTIRAFPPKSSPNSGRCSAAA